jgi:UDP-2,3-diacylglucosamine hydrolase
MTAIFVADLHLCSKRPALTKAFVNFIEETVSGYQELYLLGDIFEAWIGDDYLDPAMLPVIKALKTLSNSGTKLYFQHGNRDFLVGNDLMKKIGATLLGDSHLVTLETQIALVMHGDQLCTDDIEYQKFRSMVRSENWRNEFLSKDIEQRLQIAEHLRNQSKEHSSKKSQQITDVNPHKVVEAIDDANVRLLIHGHTHRPKTHTVQMPNSMTATRMVLGDWGQSLWYIKSDIKGCELIEQRIS